MDAVSKSSGLMVSMAAGAYGGASAFTITVDGIAAKAEG
jgi:hypothetical protein